MNNFIKFCRDRAKINLVVDIILFLLLMGMAGIGFLIKYTLLSGEKRNLLYGKNVNLELLGLDRHQWGTIHLIVSIAFIVFIVIHIILHWKLIGCFFRRLFPKRTPRIVFISLLSVVSLFLFVFAFLVTPNAVEYGNLYRHRVDNTSVSIDNVLNSTNLPEFNASPQQLETEELQSDLTPQEVATTQPKQEVKAKAQKNRIAIEDYEVLGMESLAYVSVKYDVPSEFLCNELNIPKQYANERLGRLRRRYNFTMSDVSRAVAKYVKSENK
ncbi:MAG TPA: DUF4405 domain-containing protein [Perlabentimonas sp.]|nr:DUF4405 domain-containing protein [Bacteroidales bacterium]HZJ73307.1 DUF4405 domain-containing protein [Perlabentimonas sp.]